jgi:proteasome lid subunit RPN8/RPN11
LSDEEIQFDEVAYREPHKARRPDYDPKRACIAYRVPGPDDLPIFLDKTPADHIERHALRDTSVELGGILLGKECVDEASGLPFVWVTEAIEAKHYENTQASFTYTHDSWGEITRERDEKHPELDIVGWYHTHPDFGIFLSSHDLFIHHNFFDQPLQVAYVVDPIRQDRGFFRWKDGQMEQVGGFWLTADRNQRAGLARLVNDLEGIADSSAVGGGGGTGLSPRLEAELIAMLSRPQTVAVAADRGQSAAVFTLLGVFVGALAVAGMLWLQSLGKVLQDQADQLKTLAHAQERAAAAAKETIAGERISAKEAALDAILRDVKADASGAKVAAKLSEIVSQRDEAKRSLSRAQVEREALADRATMLDARVKEAEERAEKALARSDAETKDLKESFAKMVKENEELESDVQRYSKLFKDNGVSDLLKRYNWAWYLALAGWGGFLACGIGVASLLASRGDDPRREDGPPSHTTISIT